MFNCSIVFSVFELNELKLGQCFFLLGKAFVTFRNGFIFMVGNTDKHENLSVWS